MIEWESREVSYRVVLDEDISYDDEPVDDYNKLAIALPLSLAEIQDRDGMIDYGSIRIEGSRDELGNVILTIHATVLSL